MDTKSLPLKEIYEKCVKSLQIDEETLQSCQTNNQEIPAVRIHIQKAD